MLTKRQASCIAVASFVAVGVVAKPPPLSIVALQAETFDTRLEFVRRVEGGTSFDAQLVSYVSAGLKAHALIATPRGRKLAGGFTLPSAVGDVDAAQPVVFLPHPASWGTG